MAKFYIIDEPETNKLWLIDLEHGSAECLDKDVISSTGSAGSDFLAMMGNQKASITVTDHIRSDPSERAYSFDSRSDPSERAYSFDGRSDPSERAYSFDNRGDPAERMHFFSPCPDSANIIGAAHGREDASDRSHSSSPVVASGYRSNPSDRSHSAGPSALH